MERGRPKKENFKTTIPPQNGNYYTITEAVELLGVHRHTLQARLRDGTIKGKLIGRTWRIYKDELLENGNNVEVSISNYKKAKKIYVEARGE